MLKTEYIKALLDLLVADDPFPVPGGLALPTIRQVIDFLVRLGEAEPAGVEGDSGKDAMLVGISPDQLAGPGALAWLSPKQAAKFPDRARSFRGSLLLAPREPVLEPPTAGGRLLRCRNPKLAFSRTVLEYFPSLTLTHWPDPRDGRVHAGTKVGQRVVLAPGVVIGSGVSIGDDVLIGPNTCIANSAIASNVTIGCNCSIGLPGFGYERDADGRYWRFPHVGSVVIEEGVEIGSNTCIDRGAIGDTIIGSGSKLDNLVHIAHNVKVGRNVMVIANSMIGGSTTLADDTWIAPSAALMNQIQVGKASVVGLGAVVLKDVPDATTVVGNPARPLERRNPT